MIQLTPEQRTLVRERFLPDRPGPLVALHVLNTGHGRMLADRWPAPRAIIAETAGNFGLSGDPEALSPDELRKHVTGFIEAPDSFAPLLRQSFSDLRVWERIVLALAGDLARPPQPDAYMRRLWRRDSEALAALSAESSWIANTWGGAEGLASSGYAWGGFVDGRLVAVACAFFVGAGYEEIGVVTEAGFRGRGISAACAHRLCQDILERDRVPSWTTSADNSASLRVAEKLGFTLQRHDVLYIAGVAIPRPPGRAGS